MINENIVPRPGKGNDHVFANALSFRRHTAESKGKKSQDGLSSDKDQFSAAKHYVHPSGEAFPSSYPGDKTGQQDILHDGVIATPTLEVGVDMKNLGNVITHRAMRNISSYRQGWTCR